MELVQRELTNQKNLLVLNQYIQSRDKKMEKNPKDPIEYETILSMKRFACQSLKYYKISMHAYDRE